MPTDDERRHVARKMRLGGRPSLVKLMAYLQCGGDELFKRLADYIDPDDGVIDFEDEKLKKSQKRLGPIFFCGEYQPDFMVDRDALLALADEIEDNDVTYSVSAQYVLDGYARRIREALGVDDG